VEDGVKLGTVYLGEHHHALSIIHHPGGFFCYDGVKLGTVQCPGEHHHPSSSEQSLL